MKREKLTLVAVLLSGSLLFSSCVGSFGLFNRLSSWNQSIGSKFVNELVFLAFNIVPVYGVSYLADALVINSIEFWGSLSADWQKRFHGYCLCLRLERVHTSGWYFPDIPFPVW